MSPNQPTPKHKRHGGDSGGLQTLVQAEKLMQIALLLPSAAFVGWLIGAWLDHKFHQSWIGLAGIVFGGIAGLVHVVRMVIEAGRNPASHGLVGDGEEDEDTGRQS